MWKSHFNPNLHSDAKPSDAVPMVPVQSQRGTKRDAFDIRACLGTSGHGKGEATCASLRSHTVDDLAKKRSGMT